MKNLKIFVVLFAVALLVFACSQNSAPVNNSVADNAKTNSNAAPTAASTPDELASARKIYSEKCIKCHKEDGTGGVTDIEGTKIKAPNFTSDRMKNDSDADWIEVIENGAKEDGMPAYKGKISDEDIKNLVKFIRREFQGK